MLARQARAGTSYLHYKPTRRVLFQPTLNLTSDRRQCKVSLMLPITYTQMVTAMAPGLLGPLI